MQYLFKPLDQHVDAGFGATGDAFLEAAERLANSSGENTILHGHLPTYFLYRHAIELYFKSMILVLQGALKLKGCHDSHERPLITVGGKQEKLYTIHSIGTLHAYWLDLLSSNRDQLATMARTNWSDVPPQLAPWIKLIEANDPTSTMLRYPVTGDEQRDRHKSSWKSTTPAKLLSEASRSPTPMKLFFGVNDNDEIVQACQFDEKPMEALSRALVGAADLLSAAHIGIRMELAGGN